MSKKRTSKKIKSAKATVPDTSPRDPAEWRAELAGHVAERDWQKAITTALGLRFCTEHTEADAQLCAKVAEAALRELMETGKENRFRKMVGFIQQHYLDWTQAWPLGLQVATCVVSDLEERMRSAEFAEQLRQEIWTPIEMAWSGHESLRQDGVHVLDAWRLVEQRDFATARQILGRIGRQSPLIDWRLLLQAMMAAHLEDEAGALTATQRIRPTAPVRRAAAAILPVCDVEPAHPALPTLTPLFQPLTLHALMGQLIARPARHDNELMELMLAAVKKLHADGRHELAAMLPVAYGTVSTDDAEDVIHDLIGRLVAIDKRLALRCRIRAFAGASSSTDSIVGRILATENALDERGAGFSRHERAIISLLLCRSMHAYVRAGPMAWFMDDPSMVDEYTDAHLLISVARAALADWPELEELYELWHQAEKRLPVSQSEALTHWSRHDPENVEVLIRCIKELLERKLLKRAEAALKRLEQFPGVRHQYTALREEWARFRCYDAYQKKQRDVILGLQQQADGFGEGTLLMLRFAAQLLELKNPHIADAFVAMNIDAHSFWRFITQAPAFLPEEQVEDFLDEKVGWIEENRDALADAWLVIYHKTPILAENFLLNEAAWKSLCRMLAKHPQPEPSFLISMALYRAYAEKKTWEVECQLLDDLLTVALSLTRRNNTEWQAAGLGLAGGIVLEEYFEGDGNHSSKVCLDAMNLLFSAMCSHPAKGPQAEMVWQYLREEEYLEDICAYEMEEVGVNAVCYAVKNCRTVNGLIKKLKSCAIRRPVQPKRKKPQARAKQADATPPSPNRQLDFLDFEEFE